MKDPYSDPKTAKQIQDTVERLHLNLASRAFGRIFTSMEELTQWKIRRGYEQRPSPGGFVYLPDPEDYDRKIKFPKCEYELIQSIGSQIMSKGSPSWDSLESAIEGQQFFEIGRVSPGGYESGSSLDRGRQWHVIRLMLDHEIYGINEDFVPKEVLKFPLLLTVEVDSPPVTEQNPILRKFCAAGGEVEYFRHGSLIR